MVSNHMDDSHLLITLSNAKGQNFILKLSVTDNVLKVILTDKSTAEKWKCTFDSFYIENLSRKTGNFKQFKVFVSMLKAGLLKTNECVYVELLGQEELEARRKKGQKNNSAPDVRNRKYLILVYQVEFDKIHYPLPLEYCGRPSADLLQNTVRKLENEVATLKSELEAERTKEKTEYRVKELQDLLEKLNTENARLYDEISRLTQLLDQRVPRNRHVEDDSLKRERVAFLDRIYRLEIENRKLSSLLAGNRLCSRSPQFRTNNESGSLRRRRSRSLEARKSLSLESLVSLINCGRHSPARQSSARYSSASSTRSRLSKNEIKNRNPQRRNSSSKRSVSSEKNKSKLPATK